MEPVQLLTVSVVDGPDGADVDFEYREDATPPKRLWALQMVIDSAVREFIGVCEEGGVDPRKMLDVAKGVSAAFPPTVTNTDDESDAPVNCKCVIPKPAADPSNN